MATQLEFPPELLESNVQAAYTCLYNAQVMAVSMELPDNFLHISNVALDAVQLILDGFGATDEIPA
jgi:hypothetical protein